jgi:hypothetical protein
VKKNKKTTPRRHLEEEVWSDKSSKSSQFCWQANCPSMYRI